MEFDICETSDGEFILMHDVTVDATTNGTGNVIDMTLAQVKELVLDTGNFNDGKRGLYCWASQGKYYLQIPTLQEALDICREFGMIPQIEMKNIVNFDKFLQIITDKGFIENCAITSAHVNFLEEIRERNKKVGMRRILQGESNYTDENLEWCAERNIDMDCRTVGLTAEYVNKIHQAGLICNGWIINTDEDLKIAIELGCDSITTDNLTGLDSYQLRAKNNMPHNQITVLKFGSANAPVNDSQKTTDPLTLPSEFKGYDPEVFWRKYPSPDNQTRIQCHNRFDIPAGTTSCKVTVPSGIRTAIVGFNSDGLRIYDSGWINEGVHITGVKNVQPEINDPDTLLTYTISDCAFHVLYSSAPNDGIVNETHLELVKQIKVEYINRCMDDYFDSLSELCSTYGLEVKDYTTKDLMKALPTCVDIKLKHNKVYDAYKITDVPANYSYIRIVKSADVSMNSMELYGIDNVRYSYSYHEHSDTEHGWQKISAGHYRIITQGTAGYFKFKPCDNPKLQGIRISVTDNYGGMIDISGVTPTQTQYKPFKCIRLSHGDYTNYDAIKLANNKMLKLFYYDGYFYLKVTSYTTCTFTGLLEAPTCIETFDETVAEEIPIRSVFDTPYNDGYADPSIIVIGDTVSADGIIKTLNSLGFTGDVMTWDTGVYRISHVSGLTNLPSEITSTAPGFRLEHYDCKKWGNNHNPNNNTWAIRHSVLYGEGGNVYHRYTESGATVGTYAKDTGWRKVVYESTITPINTKIDTLQSQYESLFQSVSDGKTLVANAITGKGVSTSTSATFATMATNVGKITNYTASEKQALATAITNKGVSTSSTASFSTMATNISKIPQTITWQEETVSAVPNADTHIVRFVFSNTVLGVKQMIAPGYNYTTEATETKMFTINGNAVEVKAESGTWKMTAMVRVSS